MAKVVLTYLLVASKSTPLEEPGSNLAGNKQLRANPIQTTKFLQSSPDINYHQVDTHHSAINGKDNEYHRRNVHFLSNPNRKGCVL